MNSFFYHLQEVSYPDDRYGRPDVSYPEYPFSNLGISPQKNNVYEMIRSMFREMELDKAHYNTEKWNPLGKYIKEGQTVLIKPNLVKDTNSQIEGKEGMECLVTHPSVLRCIIDYVFIALNGTGKIWVADAPVQGCDFDHLMESWGYNSIIEFYNKAKVSIKIEDLRITKNIQIENNHVAIEQEPRFKGVEVNLGKESYFYGNEQEGRTRITNYNHKTLNHYHEGENQKYCISEACLLADVIINMPKPKSHRKAGYTGALKNFVGVNTSKEYLPHHTKGSYQKGEGDEYYSNQFLNQLKSWVQDSTDMCDCRKLFALSNLIRFMWKVVGKLGFQLPENEYSEGSWWGNNTAWKMILDVNRAVCYADRNGVLRETPQRTCIHIGDMIYCGEKEGPLLPSPIKVNGILFSENVVLFDYILTKLMGFQQDKLAVLTNGLKDVKLFDDKIEDQFLNSNDEVYKKNVGHIDHDFKFHASAGWTGVIDQYTP